MELMDHSLVVELKTDQNRGNVIPKVVVATLISTSSSIPYWMKFWVEVEFDSTGGSLPQQFVWMSELTWFLIWDGDYSTSIVLIDKYVETYQGTGIQYEVAVIRLITRVATRTEAFMKSEVLRTHTTGWRLSSNLYHSDIFRNMWPKISPTESSRYLDLLTPNEILVW